MNILYLTNHLNIGGITSYVLTLAQAFKKRGHKVYIASSGGKLLSKFIAEGIVYLPIPIKTKSEVSYKILISKYKLLKIIREKNIDILHANTRVTQVLSFLIQRTYSIPYVSTCHGFFKKRLFRKMFPCWGNKVIAISESVKEHLRKDFKVKEEDIRIIHNGIDLDKFNPALYTKGGTKFKIDVKKKLGLGEGPVVGIVARLSEEKGHLYLIKAMKSVLSQIPQAQLLIVGNGRMKKELLELTKNLGMEKNIFFLAAVDDTKEVLAVMDLFVLPSLKEGLGLALMEAMAFGLGVIGSDVGGIRSLIQNGYNGLLVRPADIQGLSCAILELLQNPDKARSLGNNARIFIEKNFSQEKMALETERVYLECLNPTLPYSEVSLRSMKGRGKRNRIIIVLSIIFLLGLLGINFLQKNYVAPIIMYHSVHPNAAPGNRLVVSPETFERQMRFLKEHRYKVLPLESIATLIGAKKRIPSKALAITFDDGYKDNYIYAFPILKKYHLPVTVFVIVNEVGRADRLSWDEIKEMQDTGIVTFGSHAVGPEPLVNIKSIEELKKQIFDSKMILEEKLGQKISVFSYPEGRFNDRIKQLVKACGYKLAVATNPGKKYPNDDVFALKRLRISENASNLFIFWVETSGYYNFIRENRHK